MTSEQLGKLFRARLKTLSLTTYQLHMGMVGKCSHQTVYNAVNGKPIKTDTLLMMLDALDLKIVAKEDTK